MRKAEDDITLRTIRLTSPAIQLSRTVKNLLPKRSQEATRKRPAVAKAQVRAHRPTSAKPAPLTISRPELLINGSDRHFRRLVHGLFGFLARHEAVRTGHGARIGLVGIEYTVLISIRHLAVENPDVSVSRVAAHLYLSGTFVTTVTNKLLKRGLIHKLPDPADRRRVRLEVSERGNALLAELAPVQRQVNDVQFGCLSTAEFLHLLDMIERLIESGDQAIKLQSYFGQRPTSELARPADLTAHHERDRQRFRQARKAAK